MARGKILPEWFKGPDIALGRGLVSTRSSVGQVIGVHSRRTVRANRPIIDFGRAILMNQKNGASPSNRLRANQVLIPGAQRFRRRRGRKRPASIGKSPCTNRAGGGDYFFISSLTIR
ncbi:hypothetical protein SAMN04488513_11252 [Pseudozobellia thermophila]|uniref:Uncharacterized protein n=1 Tax=Pseudozobellia thermophila TaxID=192903 RepID=A0A1M6N6Y9_9FLAO|nr:hypothetical protein SAMN04488513_11252 [Pseudozobellia thermophila]